MSKDEVATAEYKKSAEWTSFNHLAIVIKIETELNCLFTRSEILRFKSFHDGVAILQEKGLL